MQEDIIKYIYAAFWSWPTIFRSSYSCLNSRSKVANSATRSLQHAITASFGVISPSVWTRSSKVGKSGWGTCGLLTKGSLNTNAATYSISSKKNVAWRQEFGSKQVCQRVILLVENKIWCVWHPYNIISIVLREYTFGQSYEYQFFLRPFSRLPQGWSSHI